MRIIDWSSDVCSSDLPSWRRSRRYDGVWKMPLSHHRCPCHESNSCHEPTPGEFIGCLVDLIDGDFPGEPFDQFAEAVVEGRFGREAEHRAGKRPIGETMPNIAHAIAAGNLDLTSTQLNSSH